MVGTAAATVGIFVSIGAVDVGRAGDTTFAAPVSCSEELVADLIARHDLTSARAALASFKDASKTERDCAARVWQQGITRSAQEYLQMPSLPVRASSSVFDELDDSGVTACAARVEDGSWLNIPRLQEILVCMDVPKLGRTLLLEQDGFLRAFDMPTVLWPAGFFLTLWVADNCQEVSGNVLELGAGVGAPSIAASLCAAGRADVWASDKEAYSLASLRNNVHINGANVTTRLLDWNDKAGITALLQLAGPFDLILGAGLAPHRWTEDMWNLFHTLLRPRTGKIVLAHGLDDLNYSSGFVGGGRFSVERAVNGDTYGLQTRWGTSSEFELLVLRLRHSASDEL